MVKIPAPFNPNPEGLPSRITLAQNAHVQHLIDEMRAVGPVEDTRLGYTLDCLVRDVVLATRQQPEWLKLPENESWPPKRACSAKEAVYWYLDWIRRHVHETPDKDLSGPEWMLKHGDPYGVLERLIDDMMRLAQTNTHTDALGAALEFYANPVNHRQTGWQGDLERSPVDKDSGKQARAALEAWKPRT